MPNAPKQFTPQAFAEAYLSHLEEQRAADVEYCPGPGDKPAAVVVHNMMAQIYQSAIYRRKVDWLKGNAALKNAALEFGLETSPKLRAMFAEQQNKMVVFFSLTAGV